MEKFPQVRFRGELRPSQKEVVEIARQKLTSGKKRLHIVAPPGSGKTVLGLFLWAECIASPAVVLSPNSAIQAQWAARTDLFDFTPRKPVNAGMQDWVSTDPHTPALLTSLTYQSVTLPQRASDQLDDQAEQLWKANLIDENQAENEEEATAWIEDLKEKNQEYYQKRLGSFRKRVRDEVTTFGNSLDVLHASSRKTLERLREQKVGLIILDECHHLMGHWGRVLADARELLGDPYVIGLTATPPDRDGKKGEDIQRYDEFFGEIDYEVPVPAVVKDGFLAPYQDLAYFVRPTAAELEFVATTDAQLDELVKELCNLRPGEAELEKEAPAESSDATDDSLADGITPATDCHGGPTAPSAGQDSPAPPAPSPTSAENASGADSLLHWLFNVLDSRQMATTTAKDWYSFERRDEVFTTAARKFLQRRKLKLPAGVPSLDMEIVEEPCVMEDLVPLLDRYVRHALRRSPESSDHQLALSATSRLRMLGMQITDTGTQACASPVGRVLAYSRNKATEALPEILKHEMRSLGDSIRAVVVTDFEKSSATHAEIGEILDSESGGAIAAFRTLVRNNVTDQLDPILLTGSSVLVDDDALDSFFLGSRTWLDKNGFQVELTANPQEGFQVILGTGADWCPRVYVQMITELFQTGVTKCLVGTRGLLGEGWDANKINVLIDLTTVTTSMTVNQLRGRSIRIDPQEKEKLANNWDVICIAPEFTKGLDDYKRFEKKHKTLFGVTDDGAIEKGVGHVHAAFTELKPAGIEGSTRILNEDMLTRAGFRSQVRDLWKIGETYENRPIKTVEARLPGMGQIDFPPFSGEKNPWDATSLTTAIGNAILYALSESNLIKEGGSIQIGERNGGFLRVFLREADEEENRLFVDSLYEILGPLSDPRYMIPRLVSRKVDTWISKILPSIVGRFFQKEKKVRVMFHAVPTLFSKNRGQVAVFERGWNAFVSPGEAVFTQRGSGEKLLAQAKAAGKRKRGEIQNKEIFL
ncbi:MAG: DEAD/DEAH box helicase family protein [Planctomycetota bacterium]|nr:DEAD/DEAH box helicase family protein [Planctomycetota bacterium]